MVFGLVDYLFIALVLSLCFYIGIIFYEKKTIQEILVEYFGLPKEEVDKLKKEADRVGMLLQQYVVECKLVDKHKLLTVLGEEWCVNVIDLQTIDIDPGLSKVIPVEI